MFRKIFNYIKSKCTPLDVQAKKAGVNMGVDNYVASVFWTSEPYLITIGSHCQITSGVKLLTHGGGQVLRDVYPEYDVFGKVKIGNYVYLGTNATVMPGVTIGDHVLVAAGSVVTKSIPSGYVVAGNPAHYICTIEEFRLKNEAFVVKTKRMSSSEKKKYIMQMDSSRFIKKEYIKK